VLVDGQAKGGYKISLDPGQDGLGIILNLAYDKDAEIGDLFRTTDFRRALSMGLDRDAINETFFLGTSVPGAPCPAKENPYYPGDDYRTKWATLDIAQANKLLDGLGYTNKSADGIRQRKDGKGNLQLQFMAVNRLANFPLIAEQIKIMWRKIGVDLFVDTVTSALAQQRIPAGDAQMTGNQAGGEEVFLSPDPVIGGVGYSRIMGLPYQQWVRSGGKQGKEPPQWYKDLYALWDRGYGSSQDERIKIGKQIHQTVIDQVYIIGLAGQGLTNYGIRLAKNNLGNQPGRVINAAAIRISDNLFPFMFYYQ
jgi:peptide/nickel transport system substrate-binding protein